MPGNPARATFDDLNLKPIVREVEAGGIFRDRDDPHLQQRRAIRIYTRVRLSLILWICE